MGGFEQSAVLSLYQAVIVLLSLWLGISQYGLQRFKENDADELPQISIIATGFVVLGYALQELGESLTSNTIAPAIRNAVLGIKMFFILVFVSVVLAFFRQSDEYEPTIKNWTKVIVGTVVFYGLLNFLATAT